VPLRAGIENISGAVEILYVLCEGALGDIENWTACTFGVYEVRGKRIGITSLHDTSAKGMLALLRNNKINSSNLNFRC
jgi:hypothetical protein